MVYILLRGCVRGDVGITIFETMMSFAPIRPEHLTLAQG